MKINILSINEFKESTKYIIAKWFLDKKRSIEDWFETDDFKDLEYDYYEYDVKLNTPIYVGFIFFNEQQYQYKLEMVLDVDDILDIDNMSDVFLTLYAYDKNTQDLIGTIDKTVAEPEIIPQLIIELISDFKTEYDKE